MNIGQGVVKDQPEFLQLRLFGGVKIKKNSEVRANLQRPLTMAEKNVLKDFIQIGSYYSYVPPLEEWPW